jgi:hypothetical protein
VSHKGIRLLIENTAKSLGDDIQFTYARASDFNVMRDKRYPFITLDPLTANAEYSTDGTSNYTKTFNASMAFYGLDKEASIQEEYALILDEMDAYVDNFVQKLNLVDQPILISAINQTPFVKATGDVLTGFLLSFQIQVPDNYDYCADC